MISYNQKGITQKALGKIKMGEIILTGVMFIIGIILSVWAYKEQVKKPVELDNE